MHDQPTDAARGLMLLAELARRAGVERVADLGNMPPFGTPEFADWAREKGIDLDGLEWAVQESLRADDE